MTKNLIPLGMSLIGVGPPSKGEYYIDRVGYLRQATDNHDIAVFPIVAANNPYGIPLDQVVIPEGYELLGGSLDTAYKGCSEGDIAVAVNCNDSPYVFRVRSVESGWIRIIVVPKKTKHLVISIPFTDISKESDNKLIDRINDVINCTFPVKHAFINNISYELTTASNVTFEVVEK